MDALLPGQGACQLRTARRFCLGKDLFSVFSENAARNPAPGSYFDMIIGMSSYRHTGQVRF